MGTSADIAGAVIGGVGAVLFIISFSTVFWFSTRTVHYGLFQACGTSRCIDIGECKIIMVLNKITIYLIMKNKRGGLSSEMQKCS